ncbi:uncharacterized protein [Solanum lycopersicum]|uniref:uncharacterized protein n=1 Tax=Solanum lycopersicum TaxID=4081 RepID=UPI0002BCC531|nr:uncharacterized protein LOC101264741 [Solanum lycopersicum]
MGLTSRYKVELATYQLKGVAQTWYVQWRDKLWGGLVTWEVLKKGFLDRFFLRDKREAKVVEFINLHQGDVSVIEYSLKFTQLTNYAPFLAFDPRDEINRFVMEVSDDLQENIIRARDDRVSNPNLKKGKDTSYPNTKPTCAQCGKGYLGEYLFGMGICFGCGNSGYKVRDFPNVRVQDKGIG